MKTIFLGCTKFSEQLLKALLTNEIEINCIFSIPEKFNISYSKNKVINYNYADLKSIANQNNIPFYWVDSKDGIKIKDYIEIIEAINPDVILVLGWYYMVPKSIRNIARFGAWGIHASLLPNYAGGAPLVWAIINGEKETGVTLFRLDDGVDDGDIISQRKISIKKYDTIQDVYKKAISVSKTMLIESIKNADKVKFMPQDKSKIKIYPQRKPEDGKIDWTWDSKRIKNFIRAQTKPYPGAWTIINDKKIIIWDANIIDL
ncbi:MAG: methionyl-tRNA formyltransferase [Bacteroidia bacterium]|nr:methionyl-tRNA formyltransferase [Bacteroidia bacterium]